MTASWHKPKVPPSKACVQGFQILLQAHQHNALNQAKPQ